ncbi:MAG TPA: hypothetical protein VJS42_22000 [Steroidobacteraceae bacterium]|nr:hypothetical protein [Steroidobacteraceae bacterium]
MRRFNQCLIALIVLSLVAVSPGLQAAEVTKKLPQDTHIYLTLKEGVSGKRKKSTAGQVVKCTVWRDVAYDGATFIGAGAPAVCKISEIKRAQIAGVEGKMSIEAVEVATASGTTIPLRGGYMKEGQGRKALSITLGVLFLLPIFITGSAAELPEGMVFDAYTVQDTMMTVSTGDVAPPAIDLTRVASGFQADVDYSALAQEQVPKVFKINLSVDGALPAKFLIDNVNGKPIDPIQLAITSSQAGDEASSAVGEVGVKSLMKHFIKGINRFEVCYADDSGRHATEVILNIQI